MRSWLLVSLSATAFACIEEVPPGTDAAIMADATQPVPELPEGSPDDGSDGDGDGDMASPEQPERDAATEPPDASSCEGVGNLSLDITGRIVNARGEPIVGHVVLRDRAILPGAIFAEATANRAGFFLLNADGISRSRHCWDYWIEVDNDDGDVALYGELNANEVLTAAREGSAQVDISDAPIVVTAIDPGS
jgi:hypothetical protein